MSFATLAQWIFLSLACIAGRRKGITGIAGCYRSPLFPLPQVLTLLAVAALTVLVWSDRTNGRPGVITVFAVILVSMLYH